MSLAGHCGTFFSGIPKLSIETFVQTFVEAHLGGVVVILMSFSSLAAPEVVILTTSSVTSGWSFVGVTTFSFRCWPQSENRSCVLGA